MSARQDVSRENTLNDNTLPTIKQKYSGDKNKNGFSETIKSSRNISYNFGNSIVYTNNLSPQELPYYDYFSESDSGTGTPDLVSDESDSSAGSALSRNDAAATKILAEEWEKIERTLYDEDGEKVDRRNLIEECKQWKLLVPHLRILGKKIPIPEMRHYFRRTEEEEVHALNRTDCSDFSESEERLSDSSLSDTTLYNSPIIQTPRNCKNIPASASSVRNALPNNDLKNFQDSFNSILQITPLYQRTPSAYSGRSYRQYSSILKSEISSSKWTRNTSPDIVILPQNLDNPHNMYDNRNSATPLLSLGSRKSALSTLSAKDTNKLVNGKRVLTARQRDMSSLSRYQPMQSRHSVILESKIKNNRVYNSFDSNKSKGKVSLPPILHLEEKSKLAHPNSAIVSKHSSKGQRSSNGKQKSLIPIGFTQKGGSDVISNLYGQQTNNQFKLQSKK